MVIVIKMFLAGFDATTLSTLWVDKNLRAHGPIQAFANAPDPELSEDLWHVASFRDLEDATHDALALIVNKDALGIVLLGLTSTTTPNTIRPPPSGPRSAHSEPAQISSLPCSA